MQDTLQNPETSASKPKASPVTVGLAVAVAAVVLLSLWLLFEPFQAPKRSAAQKTLSSNMTPTEREYTKKIEIGQIALSRAENFLHQEVTTLKGEIYNAGMESVLGLRLTTEFSDEMNQIVLRETRSVLGTPEVALAPGERRQFEIAFDHVPNSWNMQTPAVRVSYLQLAPRKH